MNISLPSFLTGVQIGLIYLLVAFFMVIQSIFHRFGPKLRFLLAFYLPLTILVGLLFVDTVTLPFLTALEAYLPFLAQLNALIAQSIVNLFNMMGLNSIWPLIQGLTVGLESEWNSTIFFVELFLVALGLWLVISLFASLLRLRHRFKVGEERYKAYRNTPVLSVIVSLVNGIFGFFVIYTLWQLTAPILGIPLEQDFIFNFVRSFMENPVVIRITDLISQLTMPF